MCSNSRRTQRHLSVPPVAVQPLRGGRGLARGQGVTTRACKQPFSRRSPSLKATVRSFPYRDGSELSGPLFTFVYPLLVLQVGSSAGDSHGVFPPTAHLPAAARSVLRWAGYVLSSGPGCSLTFHPSASCSATGCLQRAFAQSSVGLPPCQLA